MDDTSGGFSGWLGSLFGGGNQPTSLTAPGQTAPTPDSAGLPVNANDPTLKGGIAALGNAAPAIQKAMQGMQGQQQGGGQPSLLPPRPMPNPYATALASVMAGLNAKNKIGQPQQQAAPAQSSLPGGTQ